LHHFAEQQARPRCCRFVNVGRRKIADQYIGVLLGDVAATE
jgi:hypothetical protein